MLRKQIEQIAADAGAGVVAVAFYDYASDAAWSLRGDRPFHAASTIKVAVLFALFEAFEQGALPPEAELHVRNRFLSAVDGEPYRVGSDRDGNGDTRRSHCAHQRQERNARDIQCEQRDDHRGAREHDRVA